MSVDSEVNVVEESDAELAASLSAFAILSFFFSSSRSLGVVLWEMLSRFPPFILPSLEGGMCAEEGCLKKTGNVEK